MKVDIIVTIITIIMWYVPSYNEEGAKHYTPSGTMWLKVDEFNCWTDEVICWAIYKSIKCSLVFELKHQYVYIFWE